MWHGLNLAVPYIWCWRGCSSLGLLPWPSCSALSRTQTAELTPHASRLWISDLTALLAFPSIINLSCPLLSSWPTPLLKLGKCPSGMPALSLSLSLSLSLVSEVKGTVPGAPLTPAWGAHRLAWGYLANRLGILCQTATQAGDARPWEPVRVILSSLSLLLSLCFPFLHLRWQLNSPSSLLWPNGN
jgi:hypothetical protein